MGTIFLALCGIACQAGPSVDGPGSLPAAPAEPVELLPFPKQEHLRLLLQQEQYEVLESTLESYRAAFLWDIENGESPLVVAYKAFEEPDHELMERIDGWVEARARSYQAYTARAYCAYALGAKARGGAWFKNTKPEQIRLMDRFYRVAVEAAGEALELQPRSVAPHRIRVAISKQYGSRTFPTFVEEALRAFPASYNIRVHVMYGLQPRWLAGRGDYRPMQLFAEASQAFAANNPRLKTLLGYPAWGEGQDLESDKRYAEAFELYTKALTFGEESDFLIARLEVARRLHRYDQAFRDAKRLDELDLHFKEANRNVQKTAESVRNFAADAFRQGRWEDALAALDVAVREAPQEKAIWNERGWMQCNRKRIAAGLADLEQALAVDPDFIHARSNITHCLLREGRLGEAIRRQEAYVLEAPGNGKARLELAKLHLQAGDPRSAIVSYDIACQVDYGDACSNKKELLEVIRENAPTEKLVAEWPMHPQEAAETTAAQRAFMKELEESTTFDGKGPLRFVERQQPIYPRWALEDRLSGSVEIKLYFNADGSVAGAKVLESKPAGVFDLAAVTAVLRWRAEPMARGMKGVQRLDFAVPNAAVKDPKPR